MASSAVTLPPDVGPSYEVYLNGVRQQEGSDYVVKGRALIWDRELRKDKVSGWRWWMIREPTSRASPGMDRMCPKQIAFAASMA